ncbi:MAG: hypothetical protein LAP13_14615 [Acidobacteriia bacterium]|nr:hypothetical protein [Terriglobia bacterium]
MNWVTSPAVVVVPATGLEADTMVMGFNTDIKFNGVVYHIQTEPRRDAGIETTVYTRGAILHSLKTSYQAFLNSPDYSEEKLRRLLEDQHRQVIARIRAGEIKPRESTAARS